MDGHACLVPQHGYGREIRRHQNGHKTDGHQHAFDKDKHPNQSVSALQGNQADCNRNQKDQVQEKTAGLNSLKKAIHGLISPLGILVEHVFHDFRSGVLDVTVGHEKGRPGLYELWQCDKDRGHHAEHESRKCKHGQRPRTQKG